MPTKIIDFTVYDFLFVYRKFMKMVPRHGRKTVTAAV